jgi:hypothetical protein
MGFLLIYESWLQKNLEQVSGAENQKSWNIWCRTSHCTSRIPPPQYPNPVPGGIIPLSMVLVPKYNTDISQTVLIL